VIAFDGNTMAVGSDASAQGIHLIQRQGKSWTVCNRIPAPAETVGSDPENPTQHFGFAISIDNGLLAVGTVRNPIDSAVHPGTAYLYRVGTDCTVRSLGRVTQDSFSPLKFAQRFGYSVSVSDELIAVGAPADLNVGVSSGAVYLFDVRDDGIRFRGSVRGSPYFDRQEFGAAVALSPQGLAVGAVGINAAQSAAHGAAFWIGF